MTDIAGLRVRLRSNIFPRRKSCLRCWKRRWV